MALIIQHLLKTHFKPHLWNLLYNGNSDNVWFKYRVRDLSELAEGKRGINGERVTRF